jgi:PAS domain S-box-containing protein
MTVPSRAALELRVLILAPTGRDAALVQSVLAKSGIESLVCRDAPTLCSRAEEVAGALLIAEEAATLPTREALARILDRQPSWSDLPLLILTAPGAGSATAAAALSGLGNVTLLERPVRVAALVSAVHVALRARMRQYELRDRFEVQGLLAAIVESSDDAMISKTLDGTILTWNQGAERIFGYTAAEAVGRPITMLIPPERHEEELTILDRITRGEPVDHFETVRVTKTGRLLDISLTISPIRDASNTIIGASKVARDISAQKRTEQELREADRRKDEFLATLAHELRNPLAPIRNSLRLLEPAGKSDPTVEHVRRIMERQVVHMVRLVDDLMEVSRITRGAIELRKERLELAEVIRAAIETSQPTIEDAGVDLKPSIPPEPIVLEADAVRLTQVFANLLNNAAKYSKRGGEIRLDARRQGREAVVSVRDFGIGIPSGMLVRVFDMFTQIDSSQRGGQPGLGIGLTLVRGLVQMHGGSVTAASGGLGKGSEFTVRLPLAAVAAARPAQDPTKRSDLNALRVLVVDDNRDAADSTGMLLKSLGAEVEVVYDGCTALKSIQTFRPALVLLDLRMPGIDGYEVARRIREQPALRDVTLVALTGWSQEEDRRRTQNAGFDHHLVKPAGIDDLQGLMPALVRRGAARSK